MKRFLLISAAFITANVYLFVSAPPALPDGDICQTEEKIHVQQLLEMLNRENAEARALYTAEIVGAGKAAGLKFSEQWKQDDVHAGPLPALFLRETASHLERLPYGLGLFLGSDFPIKSANRFGGQQEIAFARMRQDGQPQHVYAGDIQRYTGMFPDLASAPACVSCHNEHPQSPKTDWKLGDTMGATTWTFPKESVDVREASQLIQGLRGALRKAYSSYLDEAGTWDSPPTIGDCWPRDGYCLPDVDVFMNEFERRASSHTLADLIAHQV